MTPLQIVYPDTALRLQALLDFEEVGGVKRVAGDEWLFEGPGEFLSNRRCIHRISAYHLLMHLFLVSGTYIPRKEVAVLETIKATVIRENQAIRLRARKEGVDREGVRRVTGNTHTRGWSQLALMRGRSHG